MDEWIANGMNGLWMDCKRIVNGYEWICIRLRHFVILQMSSADVIRNAGDKENHYQLQKLSRQWNKIAVPPSPQNDGKMNRSRIGYVSNPYRSRIILRSSFVHPFFVVLSFSLPEAETIRKQYGTIRKHCGFDTRTIGGAREEEGRNLPTQNIF